MDSLYWVSWGKRYSPESVMASSHKHAAEKSALNHSLGIDDGPKIYRLRVSDDYSMSDPKHFTVVPTVVYRAEEIGLVTSDGGR